jgi:hypothetical protein
MGSARCNPGSALSRQVCCHLDRFKLMLQFGRGDTIHDWLVVAQW